MSAANQEDVVTVRLPRTYDVELLKQDLQTLRDVQGAPQPGPYHAGEWTGIALHSMGGKDSVFPSAAGMDRYQETESLKRAPYFKHVLDDLKCPKEVVRILFLPPAVTSKITSTSIPAFNSGCCDCAFRSLPIRM